MNAHSKPHFKTIPLQPTSQNPKWRVMEIYRKLHRYIGIGTLVFLIILALSGFLLNHPSLLGAPSERTLSFAVNPLDTQHLYRGTRSGLFASDDGGQSWYEVPMLFAAENAVDIAFAPDNPEHVYVALEDLGLICSTDGGIVWEQIPLGFIPLAEGVHLQRIGVGANESLHLWTSGGLISSPDGGTTWTSVGTPVQPGKDLYTLIHQIHTGYFFADWFVYVYDVAAWGIVILSFSGLLIWWRIQFGKRRKP
ncbi:MAG: hypothetical protein ACI8V2_003540 [Candidatus Latescibacterota bacterium]|jgi:hypothetical protein